MSLALLPPLSSIAHAAPEPAGVQVADDDPVLVTVTDLNDQVWDGRALAERIAAEQSLTDDERLVWVDRLAGHGFMVAKEHAIERYGANEGERIFNEAARVWADAVITIRGGRAAAAV